MADTILLHSGSGAPPTLPDGEPAIDEAAAQLYLNTAAGVVGLPLAVQPLPKLTGDPTMVAVQTATGLAFAPFLAGGGGVPLDNAPWCVPGLTPMLFGSTPLPAGLSLFRFDLPQPATMRALQINLQSDAIVILGVQDQACDVLYTSAANDSSFGLITVALNLALKPGRYYATANLTAPSTADAVVGAMNGSAISAFPISMQIG